MSKMLVNRGFFPEYSVNARPFVQWVGSKRSSLVEIHKRVPNKINTYWEPFVGGGAVFYSLYDKARKCIISDLNKDLITTYRVIKSNPHDLIKALSNHSKNNVEEHYYYEVRESEPDDFVDVAARFIYLNKTCFNGLYRVNKKGKFNVSSGKFANPAICDADNLLSVHQVLNTTLIKLGQFDDVVVPSRGDFIYCDPPYDSTFTDYQSGGFNEECQIRLKQAVDKWSNLGANVMVSSSDTSFIRNLYKDYCIDVVNTKNKVGFNKRSCYNRQELIIISYS